MTKKTRLIILLICVACFFIGALILVPYSLGYRFDFKNMKVTEIGGIYIRTFPAADRIIVDSKISKKPNLFSNEVYVQNLLPGTHTILAQKVNYYDYFKTLPVQEKEVTKIENVLLFKKDIKFEAISDVSQSPFNVPEKYIIKTGNLYYSNITENLSLTTTQKATPIIKKISAFTLQNGDIIWLGLDGFLYKSDLNNLSIAPTKITTTAIAINKLGFYKIIPNNQEIFIIANKKLLYLNPETKTLNEFYTSSNDAKFSPDGKNIIYYDDKNVYISPLPNLLAKTNILFNSTEKITNFFWINNDYIIFTVGNKIIISEIDYRNNINSISLPQIIATSPTENIEIKNPKISFDQQTGKLYILTGETLLLSEKITP